MRKLYAFIISAAVLFGASSVNANTENEIRKITKDTPLILQHADSVSGNADNDSIKQDQWHHSHGSHGSHRSHRSHWSSW